MKNLDKYLLDDQWAETQKLDGKRLMVVVNDGKITGVGREGQTATVDPLIAAPFKGQSGHWVFDGEVIGKDYWIFDMPIGGKFVTPNTPYEERREMMAIIRETAHVHILPVARTTEEKITLAQRCIKSHAEGMILNRVDSPYIEGPQRSLYVLKAKLVETVDVVVTEIGRENKRSIGVSLYDNGRLIEVGACKISDRLLATLVDREVVELKYLYASAERKLVQPSFLRRRPDRTPESCLMEQLKLGNKQVLT